MNVVAPSDMLTSAADLGSAIQSVVAGLRPLPSCVEVSDCL